MLLLQGFEFTKPGRMETATAREGGLLLLHGFEFTKPGRIETATARRGVGTVACRLFLLVFDKPSERGCIQSLKQTGDLGGHLLSFQSPQHICE